MKAVVLLKITSLDIQETYRKLKELKPVTGSCMMFGRYDALAVLQADGIDEIRHILVSQIQPLPGVIETLPCIIVDDESQFELTEAQME